MEQQSWIEFTELQRGQPRSLKKRLNSLLSKVKKICYNTNTRKHLHEINSALPHMFLRKLEERKLRKLRQVNTGLAFGVLVAVGFFGLSPLYPHVESQISANLSTIPFETNSDGQVAKSNSIVIGSIGLDAPIAYNANGFRIQDESAEFGEDYGNVVIAAPRFLYSGIAHTLYRAPDIKLNSPILIYWEGKEYTYQVDSIEYKDINSLDLEYATEAPQLTLITNANIWRNSNTKIVIKATTL